MAEPVETTELDATNRTYATSDRGRPVFRVSADGRVFLNDHEIRPVSAARGVSIRSLPNVSGLYDVTITLVAVRVDIAPRVDEGAHG